MTSDAVFVETPTKSSRSWNSYAVPDVAHDPMESAEGGFQVCELGNGGDDCGAGHRDVFLLSNVLGRARSCRSGSL